MNKELESWIRTRDEKYDGCLVGNRKGFEGLKSAIEELFERGEDSTSIAFYADADFELLVLAEEPKIDETKRPWQLQFAGLALGAVFIIWLVVLPVYGIYSLYDLLSK